MPNVGATVRVKLDPHGRPRFGDGAVTTYGMWVNGVQIRSPEDDLSDQRMLPYILGTVAALVTINGFMRLRKWCKPETLSLSA